MKFKKIEQNILFGSKSQLSTENKLLLYKAILKPTGLVTSNCGARPPIQTWKYYKDFKTNISESLSTFSNDTLYHDLNVPYVRDEIKRLSQRYADRKNILTYSRITP